MITKESILKDSTVYKETNLQNLKGGNNLSIGLHHLIISTYACCSNFYVGHVVVFLRVLFIFLFFFLVVVVYFF